MNSLSLENIWQNPSYAGEVQKKYNQVKNLLEQFTLIVNSYEEYKELFDILKSTDTALVLNLHDNLMQLYNIILR